MLSTLYRSFQLSNVCTEVQFDNIFTLANAHTNTSRHIENKTDQEKKLRTKSVEIFLCTRTSSILFSLLFSLHSYCMLYNIRYIGFSFKS